MHGQKHWKYVEFGSDIMKDKYRVYRNQERLKKWRTAEEISSNPNWKPKNEEEIQEIEDAMFLELIRTCKGVNWIKFWWDWI